MFLLFATQAFEGQKLQIATPEDVGLSLKRLTHIDKVMQAYVEWSKMADAVTMIVLKVNIAYFNSFGMADIQAKKPMTNETIFRIASMTKPITSVAIMMLYEEGHFGLDDPVSKFIPSFKDPRVLIPEPSNETSSTLNTMPVKSEIAIRHLLTHTSWLTYPLYG